MTVTHIQESVGKVISFLTENPKEAIGPSEPITAVMEDGLRCRASSGNGRSVVTDMPEAVGGGGTAPSPGWLSGAALATCDATRIALRAAELGLALDTLEVTVESMYDDRGLFGIDDSVQAGPLSVQTTVKIGAAGVSERLLRDIVDYAVVHSPIADKCRRATPTTVHVTVV